MYLDLVGDGSWELKHEFVDQPGAWPANDATRAANLLSICPHGDGDVVARAGNVCFFRNTGFSDTEVKWEDAYIWNEETYCSDPNSVCMQNSECCSNNCLITDTNEAGICGGASQPTDAPSTSPTQAPTVAPSPEPTSTPVACTLASVGSPCGKNEDCCSGSCKRGKPSSRVCLAA